MAQSASSSAPAYRVKWQIPDPSLPSVATIQQGHAGPCPLIALANTLLLRRAIQLPKGVPVISEEHLLGCIASHPEAADHLDVLPRLAREVAVDPCFCGTTEFSQSPEVRIFKALGVRLVHGAIPDPQDERLACISPFSYNQVCDQLVEAVESSLLARAPEGPSEVEVEHEGDSDCLEAAMASCVIDREENESESGVDRYPADELGDGDWRGPPHLRGNSTAALPASPPAPQSPEPARGEDAHKSLIAENAAFVQAFLDDHKSMLTYHGLALLHETLEEGELAVHFFNDHFSVLRKHQTRLYTLVTDVGFLQQPSIMYESLNDLDGNNGFHDANFKPANIVSNSVAPTAWSHSAARNPAASSHNARPQRATDTSSTGTQARRKSHAATSKSKRSSGCVVV